MKNSKDLFEQILRDGPSQNTIFLLLRQMKEDGRVSEVIRECLKALESFPNDLRLRILLAESYLELGFIGQAETELEKITSGIEELMSAYGLQAEIYAGQNRPEEATEALKRYLAHNPEDQKALDLLAELEPVEEKRAPEPPFGMAEEAGPALEEEFAEEVKEEVITEPPEAAEEVFTPEEKRVEEKLPPEVPQGVAEAPAPEEAGDIAALEEERVQGVLEGAEPVKEEGGEAPAGLATTTLAEIYYEQGEIHEAISTYERIIQKDPGDNAAIERLAQIKAQLEGEEETKAAPEDARRAQTEKMIAVLEGWLERIQEWSHA